jgi:3-oxoacyl-[acyl-carrier-protein] synthase III
MSETVQVVGTGSFLPETCMDNHELFELPSIRDAFDVERARGSLKKASGSENGVLEPVPDNVDALSPVEVFDRWARQVTGIRSRRVTTPDSGVTTEDMCAEAARRALAMAGMEAGDVELIVVGTVTPSDSVPNPASTVAGLLGCPGTAGFALNGACAAYTQALGTAFGLIRAGSVRTALAISGDVLTRITDYGDATTAVLFADGASAAVVTAGSPSGSLATGPLRSDSRPSGRILGAPAFAGDYAREHLYIRGQGWEEPDEPEPKLHMGGGPKVLRRAIQAMAGVGSRTLASAGLAWDDVDWVVPHQANLRITQGLEKFLELPRGRVVHNIETHGNSSASTVGIALDELLRGCHGPVPDPAVIVLTAVGGGYTMGAVALEWRGGAVSGGGPT